MVWISSCCMAHFVREEPLDTQQKAISLGTELLMDLWYSLASSDNTSHHLEEQRLSFYDEMTAHTEFKVAEKVWQVSEARGSRQTLCVTQPV
ncbi:hypothetical protein ElyMa_006680800 [Elysia marginata]|uniref:Uncharacterized protein n=1 Tax=Elysia marginata TaxID=1093978 RepID=A0AAV4INS3_9GAST|nr:hypothetical protein ElyMa_006680800 [Elysia marginata]